MFSPKPPTSALKTRHPKDLTLLVDSATNVLRSSIDEEVPDVASPTALASCSSHQPNFRHTKTGEQHVRCIVCSRDVKVAASSLYDVKEHIYQCKTAYE